MPLVRTFGFPVRVHWTAALLGPVFFALLSRWYDVTQSLAWAAIWTAVWLTVVWSHELAHAWAARTAGAPPRTIMLRPLGCLAHPDLRVPGARAEQLVSIAGPLSHAMWFVLAGVPYFFLLRNPAPSVPADMLGVFLALQAGLLFANLLPVWPMDGGRLVRAWLARRVHPVHASLIVSYVGFAGAIVLAVFALAVLLEVEPGSDVSELAVPAMLVLSAGGLLASRGLFLEAKWGEGPYPQPAPSRLPAVAARWSGEEPTPREPVAVEERRISGDPARRAAEQPARTRVVARPAAPSLQERIDELLDRIIEVGGVENLPESERNELAEASERLRRGER